MSWGHLLGEGYVIAVRVRVIQILAATDNRRDVSHRRDTPEGGKTPVHNTISSRKDNVHREWLVSVSKYCSQSSRVEDRSNTSLLHNCIRLNVTKDYCMGEVFEQVDFTLFKQVDKIHPVSLLLEYVLWLYTEQHFLCVISYFIEV